MMYLRELRNDLALFDNSNTQTPRRRLWDIAPARQPELSQAELVKNPLHLNGRTIKVLCSAQDRGGQGTGTGAAAAFLTNASDVYSLSFQFDALIPAEAVLYLGTWDACTARPAEDACSWISEPFPFSNAELGHKCQIPIPVEKLPKNQADFFCKNSEREEVLCFCVELRALRAPSDDTAENERVGAFEWTRGRLVPRATLAGEGRTVVAEVQSQSLQLPSMGDGSASLQLQQREVFGSDSQGAATMGQDCVICMSDKCDTAVLPCRHMCLCRTCADTMRNRIQARSYRCPMCRERVASLVQFQAEDGEP